MHFIPESVTILMSAALGLSSLYLAASYAYHLIRKGVVETRGRDIAYIVTYLVVAVALLSFVAVSMRLSAPPAF